MHTKEYRQPRCPHGWVDAAQCESCKTAVERDAPQKEVDRLRGVTSAMPALAPCPFCGGQPRLTLRPENAEATAYFAAVACYCGGYSACAHKMTTAPTADEAEAKVRAAWNCRA